MYDNIWAVKYDTICGFFEEQAGVINPQSGYYIIKNAKITVSALPDKKTGIIMLPQTRVLFDGAGAEELYKAFCMRFLSAGG